MTTKKLSALQTLYRAINTLQWRGAVKTYRMRSMNREVSTMTEEQRISSIKFLCKLIEKMNTISPDGERFYHIIRLADDQVIQYVNDEGIEGEVMMYSPRSHGRVIRIGDVEYGQDGKYDMRTGKGRANILGGIFEIPHIDALMRIGGFSRLPVLNAGDNECAQ